MGRQPFLTRLALGRSPLEPSATSSSQTNEYLQVDKSQLSQREILRIAQEADAAANGYVQLYDERGTPINPRAHDLERSYRQAKNDVLSSIGVVARRPSPSDLLPGAYNQRLEDLENEDSAGRAVALISMLGENVLTWWIGSIKDRVLTFWFPDNMRFQRIFDSQCELTGWRISYAGYPAHYLSMAWAKGILHTAYLVRPLERLLLATHATRKTKNFFQRWKHVTRTCFGMFIEALFYPLTYHSRLQRLGLIPVRPLLPNWRSFIPFSAFSPVQPLSLRHGLSVATLKDIWSAAATSPFVFLLAEHLFERLFHEAVFDAIETSVIRPDNPDLQTLDGVKNRASVIPGLRQESPSFVQTPINYLFVALGWGKPLRSLETEEDRRESGTSIETDVVQSIELGGHQVDNLRRLDIPDAHSAVQESINGDTTEATAPEPVVARRDEIVALSPTASEPSQNGDDPRIRITNREGIIEMEVRLPQVVSTDTVLAGDVSSSSSTRHVASPAPVEPVPQMYHHVTILSTQPAQMIGAIFKAQLVGWAVLPLKLVTFRLLARHYLSNPNTRSIGMPLDRILSPLAELRDLSWKSCGLVMSRIALCSALEFAANLALWHVHWSAVVHIGKTFFGWGTL